jgi:uncharacterized protein YsxB (DUF464 family)
VSREPKYAVKFVGYAASVIARKGHREIDYAHLDFVCGAASIHAYGGWVSVRKRTDLRPLVKILPELANELRERLGEAAAQTPQESIWSSSMTRTADTMINVSHGQDSVCVAPGTDISKFIRQITKRFTEIEQVLDQAEQIGSRINRRPYSEYIDEIGRTGLARVEFHGFGLFLGGRLIFYPNYQVAIAKPRSPNVVELHLLHSKTEKESKLN